MKRNIELRRAGRTSIIAANGVWLCLGLALGASGCSEHRISLAEFLAMQRPAPEAQPEPLPPEAVQELNQHLGPYKVGPGDVLTVTLSDAGATPPAPVQVRVDREGKIDLPIVGRVAVADRELEDVEHVIRDAYVPAVYRDAVCHVETVSVDTTEVLVFGAVARPGLVPLRRTERNLLFAIVGAGGVSELASGKATLRRVRRPGEELTLDLHDPVQLRAALTLDPLEDGDIVYVRAAQPNTVFVGGLVNRPAPQVYPAGTDITVLQALAAAGGLRTDVFPKEATLIRRLPDGHDVHVKLNLKRLAKGEDQNVTLAAGDILWVPETLETRIQDFINRSFFLRAGASVTYDVTGIDFLNRRGLQSARYTGRALQDTYDPLGFLTRNAALQSITAQTRP